MDEPTPQEIAEASAELATIAAAALATSEPVYVSERRGPTPVSEMDSEWARNAIRAGHTNSHDPRVHRALERRARER